MDQSQSGHCNVLKLHCIKNGFKNILNFWELFMRPREHDKMFLHENAYGQCLRDFRTILPHVNM